MKLNKLSLLKGEIGSGFDIVDNICLNPEVGVMNVEENEGAWGTGGGEWVNSHCLFNDWKSFLLDLEIEALDFDFGKYFSEHITSTMIT